MLGFFSKFFSSDSTQNFTIFKKKFGAKIFVQRRYAEFSFFSDFENDISQLAVRTRKAVP